MPERIATIREQDTLTEEQQTLLDRLIANCPAIIRLHDLALGFRNALKGSDGSVLQQWIDHVKHCEFGPLVRFGYGLQKDIAAVTAAVETKWGSGQVEG